MLRNRMEELANAQLLDIYIQHPRGNVRNSCRQQDVDFERAGNAPRTLGYAACWRHGAALSGKEVRNFSQGIHRTSFISVVLEVRVTQKFKN